MNRKPIGWSRNPSLFSYRTKAALLASLGALVCITVRSQLDNFSVALPAAFILTGILSLLGTDERWRGTPWLVFLNALASVAACLATLWFGILRPAFLNESAMPVGWALALIAGAMTGLLCDEWLASAQTLRRLGFYGRRVRRSFFGKSPSRQTRRGGA